MNEQCVKVMGRKPDELMNVGELQKRNRKKE